MEPVSSLGNALATLVIKLNGWVVLIIKMLPNLAVAADGRNQHSKEETRVLDWFKQAGKKQTPGQDHQ